MQKVDWPVDLESHSLAFHLAEPEPPRGAELREGFYSRREWLCEAKREGVLDSAPPICPATLDETRGPAKAGGSRTFATLLPLTDLVLVDGCDRSGIVCLQNQGASAISVVGPDLYKSKPAI